MTQGVSEQSTRRRRSPRIAQKAGYHHGTLSRALLDGGLHLLRTVGIDGLTLRECARLAGVSQAAIRNHFADKDALLAGLAARGFEQLARRRADRRQADDVDLDGWLLLVIENYVGFAIECPDLFRLMFASRTLRRRDHPELLAAAHEGYAALRATLDAILKAEKIGVADPDSATFLLWSSMHGVAMLVIDDQDGRGSASHPLERCRQLAQLLTAGWRATRGCR